MVQSVQMIVAESIDSTSDPGERNRPSSSDEIGVMRDTIALAAEPAPVVFDRAQLMARAMGDSELVGVVIDGFLEDFPRQLALLKRDLDQGHADGSKRGLHNMKGVAATVAGLELQQWAAQMEETAKAGDTEALKSALPGLEACFARLETEMRK